MNFNVIEQAVKLLREKLKIDFCVNSYTIQTDPEAVTVGQIMYFKDPEIKLEITVSEDHNSWIEHTDLEYVIPGSDLQDGSLVDEVIGGDLSKYSIADRQALRLAFIIYNGIQYGVKREQKKSYIDKGWHSRVTNIRMRY